MTTHKPDRDIRKDILEILKEEMEAFYELKDVANKIAEYIYALLEDPGY